MSGTQPSTKLSAVSAALKFSAESIFATLFPADCSICNDLLTNISRLPVCESCRTKIKPFQTLQCDICGELLLSNQFAGFSAVSEAAPDPHGLCGLCQRARPSYVRAVSRGPYEGVLRDLVHLLKYQRIVSAAGILGEQLALALRDVMPEIGARPVMIPVPLHASKLRTRGFNQAEKIATAANKRLESAAELDARILVRKRATESQTGLTRHQRRKNIRGAFEVTAAKLHHVAGRNIILVDDVFTTGTTAEECARILLKAGAQHVWVATVARVSKLEAMSPVESREAMIQTGVPQHF